MNLEIVDVNSCKKNLVAEVASDQVEEEISRLARDYGHRVKVPGFRPGKVPLSIIKQRFAAELRSEVTQDIISRTWKQAVSERGLSPLTEPVVDKVEAEPGSPLKFVLTFEVIPEIEVTEYKGVAVTTPPVSVEEGEVDQAMERLRQEHAQFVPVENEGIQDGNYVTVMLDGEYDEGGKPIHEDDVTLVVGSPQTHREFSENLMGARVGEERAFDVAYPADYRQKRLAGKTLHYRVLVKDIKIKQVQELSDDFARDLGAAGLEELRSRMRDDLITKARHAAEEKAREAVLDQIVQRLSFEVPESMVREELEDHARRLAANLARQGIDISRTSIDWKKIFEEERPFAEKAVRHRLVLDAIARQEKLELTEEELDAEFRKIGEGGGKSAAAVRAQFEKDQRLQSFRTFLLQNKALDFIVLNATITEG